MPGTHLPLEDTAAPEIVVSSPSAASMHTNVLHSDADQDYFSVAVSKEPVRQRKDSLTTTDELDPVVNAEIIAMLAMGSEAAPHYPSDISSGKLNPVHSDEATPPHTDDAFPLDDSPTSKMSDNEAISGNLRCIVWDDPAIADEDESRRGDDSSAWSRHQVSHPSTSNHTEADTETTDFMASDEEHLDAKSVAGTDKLRKEVRVSEDDRETLQDIIRAYTGPMLYHEEAEAHHAGEHSDDSAEFQAAPLDEFSYANVKAEVEDSIRVMNRSLGG
jgi:hypothetical protein